MTSVRRISYNFFLVLVLVMSIAFALDAQSAAVTPSQITPSQIKLLQNSLVVLNNLDDSTPVIQRIDQIPYVLMGDSTHGTYEFYQQRINLSKRLIQEKNFKLIVLEGDVPNVNLMNQYVHSSTSVRAVQALDVINPQGAWLWNNAAMLNFVQWLKNYNDQLPDGEQKVSLYGIDIYSFERSRRAVIDYLQLFSPQAAQQARQRYQCFNRFENDLHRYGKAVSQAPWLSCEAEVTAQLQDFSACRFPCPEQYPFLDREAFFYAEQNARVIKNTEKSFRIQYQTGNDADSWNLRDQHMMESFLAVSEHLGNPNAIVWAHNSHLGDARATEMAERAQLNLGQLMRQHFKQQVFSIGMLTYGGIVAAADDWDSPAEIKVLLNAHPDSNEALFHSLGVPHFMLYLHQSAELRQLLNQTRLQRHVGVVYRLQDEMASHYTYTHLADQFDAIIFIDVTTPVTFLKNKY